MSIISIQNLELYLQKDIVGTDSQDKYEFLIEAIQSEAEEITNRKFDLQDLDEVYDIDGSEVQLRQGPVTSVTTVEYGNPFGDVDRTELGTTEYLRYDQIGVLRLSITARRAPQYVRVVYSAGWGSADPSASSNAPDDLRRKLMDQIENVFVSEHFDPNLKSEKQGKYSWTRVDESSPGSINSSFADKLSKYVWSVS